MQPGLGASAAICTPLKVAADREIGVLWIPVSRTSLRRTASETSFVPSSPPVRARTFRMINTLPDPRNT